MKFEDAFKHNEDDEGYDSSCCWCCNSHGPWCAVATDLKLVDQPGAKGNRIPHLQRFGIGAYCRTWNRRRLNRLYMRMWRAATGRNDFVARKLRDFTLAGIGCWCIGKTKPSWMEMATRRLERGAYKRSRWCLVIVIIILVVADESWRTTNRSVGNEQLPTKRACVGLLQFGSERCNGEVLKRLTVQLIIVLPPMNRG